MLKYYAYIRVSTKDQGKKYSIEVQREYLKMLFDTFPEKDKYEFVVLEEMKSGKNTSERNVFSTMIDVLKENDIVSIYDSSRLGRNTKEDLIAIDVIKTKNAKLYIENKLVDFNNPQDEMMLTIQSAFATMIRKQQNLKSRAGIAVKKKKGEWIFSSRLIGYRNENGKIVIDEKEAYFIRTLFREYANGKSIRQLEMYFNSIGMKTRNNERLYATTIRRYIRNPVFMGYYLPSIPNDKSYSKGSDTKIITKDNIIKSTIYPPIVTEDEWWNAYNSYRTLKRSHSRQYENRFTRHILTGLVCCGHCKTLGHNARFSHAIIKRRNKDYQCYSVKNHLTNCGAKMYIINEERLSLMFQYAYNQFLFLNDELVDYIKKENKQSEETLKAIDLQISQVQVELDENEKKLERLTEAILETESKQMRKRLEEKAMTFEIEKMTLEERMSNLMNERNRLEFEDANQYRYINVELSMMYFKIELEKKSSIAREILVKYFTDCFLLDNVLHIGFFNGMSVEFLLEPKKGTKQKETKVEIKMKGETIEELDYTFHEIVAGYHPDMETPIDEYKQSLIDDLKGYEAYKGFIFADRRKKTFADNEAEKLGAKRLDDPK